MFDRIAICCLLGLLSVPAGAEPLRLVTGDDYPPFAGRELPNQGLATEIVQRVFREMGHDTEVAFMPWKRGFREAGKGSFVGTFPYGKNEERQRDFHYSTPLYVVSQHFFVLADSGIDYRQDEDLQGRRVCIPIGYNPVKVQKLVNKGIVTLDRPVSIEDCFEMLDRGRTDLVRITDFIGWAVVDKSFGTRERFSMLEKPVREAIEHLIVSKDLDGGEGIVAEFDAALERLEQAGVIGEMKRRHLQ